MPHVHTKVQRHPRAQTKVHSETSHIVPKGWVVAREMPAVAARVGFARTCKHHKLLE